MARSKDNGEKGESNMGMVRAVMQELGADAKPLDIQKRIKEKYNKELATQIISNYKFQIRKSSGAANRGRGRKAVSGGLQVADFETVRGLVARLGADQVKQLVDVVG
jgi:hypothetical protein